MELIGSCVLEGKNLVERPKGEVKSQRVFCLASERKVHCKEDRGATDPEGGFLHCFFLWGFIWFPSCHLVLLTSSFGSSASASLPKFVFLIFPMNTEAEPPVGPKPNVNDVVMASGLLADKL